MKRIKKIAMSGLDQTSGSIADGFNVADKVTNAPSIRAVEQNCILKNNIAIIEGSMELEANSTENLTSQKAKHTLIEINYPSGFTKDNCVVLNFSNTNNANDRYSSECLDTISINARNIMGNLPKSVNLMTNTIAIAIGNFLASSWTTNYKLVLFKYK